MKDHDALVPVPLADAQEVIGVVHGPHVDDVGDPARVAARPDLWSCNFQITSHILLFTSHSFFPFKFSLLLS